MRSLRPTTPSRGTAGASAAREAERLEELFAPHATWRRRPGNNPEIARWRSQAAAERAVGRLLDTHLPGARILHDRVLSGGRQIDHVVVATTGLFVIESRTFTHPLTYDRGVLWDGSLPLNPLLASVGESTRDLCQHLADTLDKRVTAHPILALYRTTRPHGLTSVGDCAIVRGPDLAAYITTPVPAHTPLAVAGIEAVAEACLTPA